ncbi:MAG: SAM-dependent chlorinase/fluorinase [Cyanophyceae cyanobacterium]
MGDRAIALLTDFGTGDGYVGILKGVMLTLAPTAILVDLTHDVPRQNVRAGRFCLANAVDYFPPETVYLAVVDPGVGGDRRAVAVRCDRGWLVGPDNGLLGGVLERYPAIAAVELTEPSAWRTPNPSNTFHGRDLFAPVAARLAMGTPLDQLGRAIAPDSLRDLPPLNLKNMDVDGTAAIAGQIQYIDHFGNGITNIPGDRVLGKTWRAVVGDRAIGSARTYGDVPSGSLIALIGSHGWIEIACNGHSAAAIVPFTWTDPVTIILG